MLELKALMLEDRSMLRVAAGCACWVASYDVCLHREGRRVSVFLGDTFTVRLCRIC